MTWSIDSMENGRIASEGQNWGARSLHTDELVPKLAFWDIDLKVSAAPAGD